MASHEHEGRLNPPNLPPGALALPITEPDLRALVWESADEAGGDARQALQIFRRRIEALKPIPSGEPDAMDIEGWVGLTENGDLFYQRRAGCPGLFQRIAEEGEAWHRLRGR